MVVIDSNPKKIVTVVGMFFILQVFHFYVADALPSIISHFIPSCVFGVDSVSYVAYTRKHPFGKKIEPTDMDLPFNNSEPTIFLIHGFISEANNTNYFDLAKALLEEGNPNIFSLDWESGACSKGFSIMDILSFNSAVNNVPVVGEYVANFTIHLMKHYGLSLNTTTIAGHSLGAHVAGFAGKSLQKQIGQKYFQIIGLDPAGPGFGSTKCPKRLCEEDAHYVQAFHTSFMYGLKDAVGHDDFYFNGGVFQAGCVFNVCSHTRAIVYLLSSLRPGCFIGTPWRYASDATMPARECTEEICATPGFEGFENKARGTFYVKTTLTFPFCT